MTFKVGNLVWSLVGTPMLQENHKYVVTDVLEGRIYVDLQYDGVDYHLDYPNHWFELYDGQDLAPSSSKETRTPWTTTPGIGGTEYENNQDQSQLGLLRNANQKRQDLWDPKRIATPLFRATELGGECGEALNEVKKLEREKMGFRGSRTTVEKLADELADVIICADLVAAEYDIDLWEAVKRKFNETSDKVGFDIKL